MAIRRRTSSTTGRSGTTRSRTSTSSRRSTPSRSSRPAPSRPSTPNRSRVSTPSRSSSRTSSAPSRSRVSTSSARPTRSAPARSSSTVGLNRPRSTPSRSVPSKSVAKKVVRAAIGAKAPKAALAAKLLKRKKGTKSGSSATIPQASQAPQVSADSLSKIGIGQPTQPGSNFPGFNFPGFRPGFGPGFGAGFDPRFNIPRGIGNDFVEGIQFDPNLPLPNDLTPNETLQEVRGVAPGLPGAGGTTFQDRGEAVNQPQVLTPEQAANASVGPTNLTVTTTDAEGAPVSVDQSPTSKTVVSPTGSKEKKQADIPSIPGADPKERLRNFLRVGLKGNAGLTPEQILLTEIIRRRRDSTLQPVGGGVQNIEDIITNRRDPNNQPIVGGPVNNPSLGGRFGNRRGGGQFIGQPVRRRGPVGGGSRVGGRLKRNRKLALLKKALG